MEPNSPFSKTDFQPFGEYSRKGNQTGFLLPDGRILVNFNGNTSHGVLAQIARQLGAELISISGTWKFTPDSEDSFKVIKTHK